MASALILTNFYRWAIICTLLIGGWLLLDGKVRNVQIASELGVAENAEVMARVKRELDGGVLSADIDAVVRGLHELSWPRAVRVRRVWPDTLVVEVDKTTVIARWSNDEYLTSAGEVVTLAEPREGLVTLDCAHAAPHEAMEMYRTLGASVGNLRLRIERLEQNLLGEWRVQFDNGIQLSLGATDIAARMNRFAFAYVRELNTHAGTIDHVDARYTNGLAVRYTKLVAGPVIAQRIHGTGH